MIPDPRLAHLLRQSACSGTHSLRAGDAQAIGRVAAGLGFPVLECDLADCRDKADFLARIAAALHFPSWFGHNWDALADCLADMSWLPAEGYLIVLENADRFRAADEASFATALEIFEQAARDWARDDVPFWVFVELTADGVTPLRHLW
jgi:RNAse (barnase) inhibitor barstar